MRFRSKSVRNLIPSGQAYTTPLFMYHPYKTMLFREVIISPRKRTSLLDSPEAQKYVVFLVARGPKPNTILKVQLHQS